jgi:carbonic anhydrase
MQSDAFTPGRGPLLMLAAAVVWAVLAATAPAVRAADAHADEPKPGTAKKPRAKAAGDDAPAMPPKAVAAKPARGDEPASGASNKKARKPAADDEEDTIAARASTTRSAKENKAGRESKPAKEGKASEREDPMDRLRERLAERLGAARAADPHVVRVTAHSPPPSPAVKTTRSAVAHGTAKPGHKPNAAATHAAHWAYEGEAGPNNWGGLKPEFTKCSTGLRQSPIDIRDGIKVQLDPVQIDYRPSGFRVLDNGHTVQVNMAPGNVIEVIGRRYELLQFHFHRPSEERVNGRQFEMVAHLVHKDTEGRLAVIAVLLDRGSAHPLVQTVWNNLPLEKGEEVPAKALIDLNVLLPTERSYFTYMGSLTTPPCSEGVLWMVMKEPVSLSAEQIGVFSRLYPMNARPIQSVSGRLIKESN